MQPTAPNLTPPAPQPNYDFIINPNKPSSGMSFNGFKSLPARIVLIAGGLLVLLVLFVVIKGLLGGSSNASAMTTVVQEQQALIHITTIATTQPGTNTTTQNSVATVLSSVSSAQSQLLAYLRSNNQSVSKSVLNQRVSTTTDAQLTTAASAGTYDSTYKTIVLAILNNYINALKTAYNQTKGPKGQALLNDDYNSAQLLLRQLST